MSGNFKLFSLIFLFIFQFISPLHECLFCSSLTPSPITFLMIHLTLRAESPNLLSDAKWSSGERMNSSAAERVHGPSLSFIQWRIQGRGPGGPGLPLFLDQTETRRAEKNFFGDRPPLSKGLDDLTPPPSLISRSGSGTVIYHQNCYNTSPMLSLFAVMAGPRQGGIIWNTFYFQSTLTVVIAFIGKCYLNL